MRSRVPYRFSRSPFPVFRFSIALLQLVQDRDRGNSHRVPQLLAADDFLEETASDHSRKVIDAGVIDDHNLFEAGAALGALLPRLEKLERVEPTEYIDSFLIRGPRRLELRHSA